MNPFRKTFVVLAAILLGACASTPPPPPLVETKLRVNVFAGATNLPLLAAIAKGYMAERKLTIEIQNTPDSDQQRAGLAAGRFEIALAAIDNALAMVENAKEDVIIVSGGDASMNEFMARGINSVAEMRGKVLAVDAPNTAYGLAAKKILKNAGLIEGRDYTVRAVGGSMARANALAANPELGGGMLNPPFTYMLREKGLKSLGTQFSLIGPYQATGAFVMRKWAAANAGALERFIAAYIEGQRYAMNPANKAEMVKLLGDRFKLAPAVAEGTYVALTTPGSGLAPDARLNMDGLRNVLAIRAEMENMWGGKPPAPDKYVDLSYYERALPHAKAK